MRILIPLFILLLHSSIVSGQKIEIDSSSLELTGRYNYCATFDHEWQMVADDDSIAHKNFLFLTCGYLTISKINKKDQKYLNQDFNHFLEDSNLYRGLKIFIGCKGGYQFMFSNDTNKLQIGVDNDENKREILFKHENHGYIGHFIYFGVKVDNNLYWFKFIKE